MRNITARVRNYTAKDGTTKGEYVKIGAVGESNGKEFILLDPSVNLAGVLIKQNTMSISEGKPARDSVMCSVFENTYDNATQQPAQHNNSAPQQQNTSAGAPQTGGGYATSQAPQMPNTDEFDDDIPF